MSPSPYRAIALASALGAFFCVSTATKSSAQSAACTFPAAMAATPEETAWRLFVAANCPTSAGHMVWEGWIEQLQFYPATAGGTAGAPSAKRLHGSPLARVQSARAQGLRVQLAPNTECNEMRGPPPNVVTGATICEEARLNPEAAAFITTRHCIALALDGFRVNAGWRIVASEGRIEIAGGNPVEAGG